MRNTRFKLLLCALALGVSAYTSTTLAVIDPYSGGGTGSFDPGVIDHKNVIQMQQYEEKKRIEKEQNADEAITMEKKVSEEMGSVPNAEKAFILNSVRYKGNTVFTEDELLHLVCDIIETEVTLSDVMQIAAKITDMYHNAGYITSFAYVPPQRIDTGDIEINIIEGKYGNVTLEGNKWARDKYITKQFLEDNNIIQGNILNIKDSQNALSEMNSIGYIKGAVTLQDNEESVEYTDMNFEAKDRFPLNFGLRFDNQGQSAVGLNRFTIFGGLYNLTGFGDQLLSITSLARRTTSQAVLYTVPIAKKETKLNLGYSYSGTRLGDYMGLDDIKGKSHSFFVGLSRRLIETENYKMYGDISFDLRNTKTTHITSGSREDLGFPYKTRNIRVNLSNIKDDFYGKWLGNVGASFGVPWFDAKSSYYKGPGYDFENDKSLPCNKAIKLSGNLTRLQVLPWRSLGIFQINGQWTNRDVWYSEKLQVGGIASVRGYQEAALLGDYGLTASAEVRFPIPFLRSLLPEKAHFIDDAIRLAAFYDIGWYGDRYSQIDSDYVMGVGGGLVLKLTKYLSGNVYFGVPVGRKPEEHSNMRVHFSITSNIL